MQAYFDIHSHILPGVDDGARDLDETRRMLYEAYEEGIRIIVATPHFVSGKNNITSKKLLELCNDINQSLIKSGLDINIIIGNELLFSMDMIDALKRGDALSIDGTRYILVEFNMEASFHDIWKGLNHCIYAGYIPILAHVERYKCFIKEFRLVGDLIDLGAYMQVNVFGTKGYLSDPYAKLCRKLLKNNWVHFIGTDSHCYNKKGLGIKKFIKYLKRKLGEDAVKRLLWENPMTMMEDRHLF